MATRLAHKKVVRPRLSERVMMSRIRRLSPDLLSELEATLERLEAQEKEERNKAFAAGISALSDESLSRIWDNPRDAEYDNL